MYADCELSSLRFWDLCGDFNNLFLIFSCNLVQIGGGNIYDKADALHFLASKCDGIVFVGMMAFQIMHALGLHIPLNLLEPGASKATLDFIKFAHDRNIPIVCPKDFWCTNNVNSNQLKVLAAHDIRDGWLPVDLGPRSLDEMKSFIRNCKKLIWIGPVKFKLSSENTKGASRLSQILVELSKTDCKITVVGNAACNEMLREPRCSSVVSMVDNASVVWDFFKGRKLPAVTALDRAYPFKIDWTAAYSNPTQPLLVDIGSGNGMFVLGMARQRKDLNFLGLEMNKKLVKRCLDALHQSGIANGHFIATNATSTFRSIVSSYPGELFLVSIQCPNPDFNKPDHRWRMLQRSLVEAVAGLLTHDGKVFLQSDIEAVALRMKEEFLKYGKGKLVLSHEQQWLEENPFGVRSDWEQHVIDRGASMYRLMLYKTNVDDDIFTEARNSGLDIRYRIISDGFPLNFDRSLHLDVFLEGILHVFSAHVDQVVDDIVRSSDVKPSCLVADTFFVWLSTVANKYNLVNVSFWTQPALCFNIYYHLHLLISHGHYASVDNRDDTIDYVPGVEAIEPKDLMSYLQLENINLVEHRLTIKAFADVRKANFVIINTVHELEPTVISTLQEAQPTFAIGPVFPTGFPKSPVVATSLWSESDCTKWLDSKPHGSVLYMSFGSYAHVSKNDIAEIAHGVLLSGVKFIWVLRPDIVSSKETDILPIGFEERIKDKGLVIPWCSQIKVISHPAIGGFLTHCGWNSVLEGIWCGIPLLCFPLVADQPTNRKLVVDDWKVGLNLCDKKRTTREEVKDKINSVMCDKESRDHLRKNMSKVQSLMKAAMSDDGSSNKNFEKFVHDLKEEIRDKNYV
ncbi:hypothetical protein ACFE04_019980 [Oxalis oulophora]